MWSATSPVVGRMSSYTLTPKRLMRASSSACRWVVVKRTIDFCALQARPELGLVALLEVLGLVDEDEMVGPGEDRRHVLLPPAPLFRDLAPGPLVVGEKPVKFFLAVGTLGARIAEPDRVPAEGVPGQDAGAGGLARSRRSVQKNPPGPTALQELLPQSVDHWLVADDCFQLSGTTVIERNLRAHMRLLSRLVIPQSGDVTRGRLSVKDCAWRAQSWGKPHGRSRMR